MDSIKDRLKIFIKSQGLTVQQFEKSCGFSNAYVNSIGRMPGADKLEAIIREYPNLNREWLLSGEGEMLISPTIPKTYQDVEFEGKNVISDVNFTYGKDANEINHSENEDYIPLLPVEAMAGTLQGFSEGVELANCRKIKSPVKGADWAIQISGDSMEPDYRNGSYLYIRKMRGAFIPWGHTMVVDTYDGVVVKNVFPVEGSNDYIEARSINPKYPPFKIEASSILGFYRVLGGSFINSTI